jgi:hypothetical protein
VTRSIVVIFHVFIRADKLHTNPSRGRRVVKHRRTDGRTDTKHGNFAEVPEGLSKAQTFDLEINTDGLFM